jgi:hypothetical protein
MRGPARLADTMALPLQNAPEFEEERRYQRVSVTLFGRYMLESREEYPCQTIEMSPGDLVLFAPVKAQMGEKVVVYLDEIGRVAGVATRQTQTGFVMTLNMPAMKRDRLADQLTWFANRHTIGLPEDRRHERIVPLMRRVVLRLPDGAEHIVKIRDISVSGVGLETNIAPEIGARIVVGSTPAVVVRHFQGGVAGEFERPLAANELDESTRL